jgi:hypothetical protein
MTKIYLLILMSLLSSSHSLAQEDFFMFKKRNKTIATYRVGSYIAFQLKNKQLQNGVISKIQNDSFYVKPYYVKYNLTFTDTIRFETQSFAISDIYAMPKKGMQIDWKEGKYRIRTNAGHVHFFWIKGGYLFRALGLGLFTTNVTNELIKNKNPFAKDNLPNLALYSSFYLFGKTLKWLYKPTLRIGKKYRVDYVGFTPTLPPHHNQKLL